MILLHSSHRGRPCSSSSSSELSLAEPRDWNQIAVFAPLARAPKKPFFAPSLASLSLGCIFSAISAAFSSEYWKALSVEEETLVAAAETLVETSFRVGCNCSVMVEALSLIFVALCSAKRAA